MAEDQSTFVTKLQLLFVAIFIAPLFLLLLTLIIESEAVTWFDQWPGAYGLEFGFLGLIVLSVGLSIFIRNFRHGRIGEITDDLHIHKWVQSTQIICMALIEFSVLITIIGYMLLRQENLIFYALFGNFCQFLYFPSAVKINRYVNNQI